MTSLTKTRSLLEKIVAHLPAVFNQKVIQEKNDRLNQLMVEDKVEEAKDLLSQLPALLAKQVVNVKTKGYWANTKGPIYAGGRVLVLDSLQSVEGLHLLTQYGIDLSVRNRNDENALWHMIRRGKHEIFRKMLQLGIRPHIKNVEKAKHEGEREQFFEFLISESTESMGENLQNLPQNIKAYLEAGGFIPEYFSTNLSPLATIMDTSRLKTREEQDIIYECFNCLLQNGFLNKSLFLTQTGVDGQDNALLGLAFKGGNKQIFTFLLDQTDNVKTLETVQDKFTISQHKGKTRIPIGSNKEFSQQLLDKLNVLKEQQLLQSAIETKDNNLSTTRSTGIKRQKI